MLDYYVYTLFCPSSDKHLSPSVAVTLSGFFLWKQALTSPLHPATTRVRLAEQG